MAKLTRLSAPCAIKCIPVDRIYSLAREADIDRYLLGLFQPAAKRLRFMALVTFHAEIAKLPHRMSEPTLGLIRTAWWREALAEIAAKDIKKKQELASILATIPDLPFAQMEALLDAYETEIEQPIPATLSELEQRILRTTHVLHQMLFNNPAQAESLQFGLASFLKSIYPLARLGKAALPLEFANPDTLGSAEYLKASIAAVKLIAEKAAHAPTPMRYYVKRAKSVGYNLLQHDISPRAFSYYAPLLIRAYT